MSQERHPQKYRPAHRPDGGSKQIRGKWWNGGSKFDKEHARVSRLKFLQRQREDEEDEDE